MAHADVVAVQFNVTVAVAPLPLSPALRAVGAASCEVL